MTIGPEWHNIRAWTKDKYSFGFVPERARHEILKLLDWLDDYSAALMDMVSQHCYYPGKVSGIVMDYALSANEYAISLLEDDGLLEQIGDTAVYRLLWENLQHE